MQQFFNECKKRNRLLYLFGCSLLIAAAICAVLIPFTSVQVLGINAWIKPFKFFLSSAIYSFSMGWLLYYLPEQKKVIVFSRVVITVLAFETIYIAIQAGRGMLSHFNISAPFYGIMFALMGVAITIMTLWTAYMGFLFFKSSFPSLSPAYVWGIRLGITCFVIFAFEGFMMSAALRHTVGAPDGSNGLPLLNWSRQHGDLRVAHFFGMHSLQLLPLFAHYISNKKVTVISVAVIYFLIVSLLLLLALKAMPLF